MDPKTGKPGQIRMLGPDGNEHWADLPEPDPYAVLIPYGTAPADVLPADRAAAVLRILHDEQPRLLSALIGRAYTGHAPAITRAPKDG